MAAPVISNISRLSGKTGDTVRVAGQDLGTVNAVTFGGGVLARITSQGFDYITFEVPAGAQSGFVTITNPDGSAQTSVFTVNAHVAGNPSSGRSPALLFGVLGVFLGALALIWLATKSDPDLSSYATTASVDAKVATKAEKSGVPTLDQIGDSMTTLLDKKLGAYDTSDQVDKKLERVKPDLSGYLKKDDILSQDGTLTPPFDSAVRAVSKEELKAACDEREQTKKEWWKKHGPRVIANRETEKLKERELLKREILRELQTTNVTTKPTPVPVAIRSIELVPDDD